MTSRPNGVRRAGGKSTSATANRRLGLADRIGRAGPAARLRDLDPRTRLLPAFEMSEAKLDGFVATIRSIRPKMLFGYPSALAQIARHATARRVGWTTWNPGRVRYPGAALR